MAWVRMMGVTARWRCGGRGSARHPPGPGRDKLIWLTDKNPVGVNVIDGAWRVAWHPTDEGGSNRGPGMAAMTVINVKKTSFWPSTSRSYWSAGDSHWQQRQWDPAVVVQDAHGCTPPPPL